jgi:hypothetical protein
MKIIFLDFDGVLNSRRWFEKNQAEIIASRSFFERHSAELDPEAVARVKRIVDETGAQVIVSSTWRLLHTNDQLKDHLEAKGWPNAPIVGRTPDIREAGRKRGDEIAMWLSNHRDVTNFVCLDDDSDFHDDQNLIQTSWEVGIEDAHVDIAIESLGRKS